MKNIDFLPDQYRQREALRHARLWWCSVVLIFGTAIGLAAGAQLWLRRGIQQQIDELDVQFAAAEGQVRELAKLQSEIAQAGRSASLFTFLDDPWPRTQILAELVRPLPETVRLTQIHIGEEALQQAAQPEAGPRRRGARHEQQEETKLAPAQQDLEQLRTEAAQRQTYVELEGLAGDVPQLHRYVAEIGRSPLVAWAQINSLETTEDEMQGRRTNFTLRVIVRAGYAASGGAAPTGPENKPATPATASIAGQSQLAQGCKRP